MAHTFVSQDRLTILLDLGVMVAMYKEIASHTDTQRHACLSWLRVSLAAGGRRAGASIRPVSTSRARLLAPAGQARWLRCCGTARPLALLCWQAGEALADATADLLEACTAGR